MTQEEIQQLIQQWVDEYQERGEEDRLTRVVEDDERDAIGRHLSDEVEKTETDLVGNNFAGVTEEVNELLAANQCTLPKRSEAYGRLCRELLKAKQAVLRTRDGAVGRLLCSTYAVFLSTFSSSPQWRSVVARPSG